MRFKMTYSISKYHEYFMNNFNINLIKHMAKNMFILYAVILMIETLLTILLFTVLKNNNWASKRRIINARSEIWILEIGSAKNNRKRKVNNSFLFALIEKRILPSSPINYVCMGRNLTLPFFFKKWDDRCERNL